MSNIKIPTTLFILFLFSIFAFSEKKVYIKEHGKSCSPEEVEYDNIQQAITAATPGETIRLCCGIHSYSSDIDVNKKVTIEPDSSCTDNHTVLFTNPCANLDLLGNDIRIKKVIFDKTTPWIGSCEPRSRYAISSRILCSAKIDKLTIEDCTFRGAFHGHIFIRTKSHVNIKNNEFINPISSAINVSHSKGNLYIKDNTFYDWSTCAICIEPYSTCSDDIIDEKLTIQNNVADGNNNGKNFIYFNHWNKENDRRRRKPLPPPPPPSGNKIKLDIKNNKVRYLIGVIFEFNEPNNFNSLFHYFYFKNNLGYNASAGFNLYLTPSGHSIPSNNKIFAQGNEFCYMYGIPNGIFLTPSEYDIGFSWSSPPLPPSPAPYGATLAMFKDLHNKICECYEKDYHHPHVCSGHGKCFGDDKCECYKNYTGSKCQDNNPECCPGTPHPYCGSHGDCNNEVCNCHSGWVGSCCQEQESPQDCCGGQGCGLHGSCSGGQCQCTHGRTGECCEIDPPSPCGSENECSEHGECIFITPRRRSTFNFGNKRRCHKIPDHCDCEEGYYGEICQYWDCYGKNNTDPESCCEADCLSPNNCSTCPQGWRGDDCCTQDCCGGSGCGSHGQCGGHGSCQCDQWWSGECCDQYTCPQNCCGHGQCVGSNDCSCNSGWSGSDCCTSQCCGGSGCGAHGICTNIPTGGFECNCTHGYGGTCCLTPPPDPCPENGCGPGNNCYNNGECVYYEGTPLYCQCKSGYLPPCCNSWICCGLEFDNPQVCNNFGSCISPNNCSCDPNRAGECCQQECCTQVPEQECSSHGQCTYNPTGVNGICQCDSEWMGTCCETEEPASCCQGAGCGCHGQCQQGEPDFCNCTYGWSGECCKNATFMCCNNQVSPGGVCNNHGVCIGQDQCQCPIGFTGPCCDEELPPICCEGEGCGVNGQCIGPPGQPGSCSCNVGWFGNCCQNFTCCPGTPWIDCGENGQCFPGKPGFPNICVCNPGFSGSCCNIPDEPPPQNCEACGGNCNNGECDEDVCLCEPGWCGECCNESRCCNGQGCGEHGTCILRPDEPWTCACSTGYSGECCEHYEENNFTCCALSPSNPLVCSGHGECTEEGCQCQQGWYGDCCCSDQFKCFGRHPENPKVCCGHGICEDEDDCICDPFYIGKRCCKRRPPPFYCFCLQPNDTHVCSGHGRCTGNNHCDCYSGWKGLKCVHPDISFNYTCFGFPPLHKGVCHDHGSCEGQDDCLCDPGFYPPRCSATTAPITCHNLPYNHPEVCCGHGSCENDNICVCEDGWVGYSCCHKEEWTNYTCYGLPPYHKDVCNDHGSCKSHDHCECDLGWHGKKCKDKVSPITCFGKPSNHPTVCDGHGDCESDDICICHIGWDGKECKERIRPPICFKFRANKPGVCSGHGVCLDDDFCRCHTKFMGVNCQRVVTCFGIPALPPTPWVGLPMSKPGDHHHHHNNNNNDECGECPPCKKDLCKCKGQRCLDCNHQACPPCHYKKRCKPKMPCSGHGVCIGYDECDCEEHWGGRKCNRPISDITCWGIPAEDPSVCHGHGECTHEDHCDCYHGFYGPQCGISPYDCFGKPPHHPMVCSGNGVCKMQDLCRCFPGYRGPRCQHGRGRPYKCFNISSKSPRVCCEHGNCIAPNTCDCYAGWGGKRCCKNTLPYKCFGIYSTEPNVCSGHGRCIERNHCDCEDYYYGERCQYHNETTCFDIPASDPEVCSGHGECSSYDNCNCEFGYAGQNCDIIVELLVCYSKRRIFQFCHVNYTFEIVSMTEGWIVESEVSVSIDELGCNKWDIKKVMPTATNNPLVTITVKSGGDTMEVYEYLLPDCEFFDIIFQPFGLWIVVIVAVIFFSTLLIGCILYITLGTPKAKLS